MTGNGETIVALSSGQGRAGVAVVRVSGPQVRFVLETTLGLVPPPRLAALRSIRDRSGQRIDHGLVLFFETPASFTGEDVAEFQIHGSRAVVDRLLRHLISLPGCRLAEPGEFTRRAVANGRLSLLQAEALADLIDSQTEQQRLQALRLADGELATAAASWRARLLAMQARLAASLDFADEGDVADDVADGLEAELNDLRRSLESVLSGARRGRMVADGVVVVIAGPPNAGKSSLLNALARRDVAITSPFAGTTRDVLEVRLDLQGIPVILKDTAGLRAALDPVEQIGVARAEQALATADIVVWLGAADLPATPPDPGLISADKLIRVRSKSDLPGKSDSLSVDGMISISTLTGDGLAEFEAALAEGCAALLHGEPPLVANLRQETCIRSALAALEVAIREAGHGAEILSENLRRTTVALDLLTGRIDVEEVLGAVFSRFCIGK